MTTMTISVFSPLFRYPSFPFQKEKKSSLSFSGTICANSLYAVVSFDYL